MKKFTAEEILEKFKESICDFLHREYPYDEVHMSDINVSQFTHVLQNYKACLYCSVCPTFCFECSYDGYKDVMYLDVYEWLNHSKIEL